MSTLRSRWYYSHILLLIFFKNISHLSWTEISFYDRTTSCGHVSDSFTKTWPPFELYNFSLILDFPLKQLTYENMTSIWTIKHISLLVFEAADITPLLVLICLCYCLLLLFTVILLIVYSDYYFFYFMLSYMVLNLDERGRSWVLLPKY